MTSRKIVINKISKINAESIRSKNVPDVIRYLDTSSITRNQIGNIQILDSKIAPFPSRAQRKVKNNTIIYSTVRPEQEHFGIIEKENEDLIVSSGFLTIDVTDKEIDPKYLYYLITRKDITNYLQRVATNNVSAYPSINPDDLGTMEFVIPSDLSTQQKIAAVLSALDAKIELNQRINAELESMAKTLYDYWFVQFATPSAFGTSPKFDGSSVEFGGGRVGVVWNEALKREIPLGWEVKKFGEVATITAGGDKPAVFSLEKNETCSVPIYSNGVSDEGLYGFTNEAKITEKSITVSARGTIGYCVLRSKPFVPIIRLIVITPHLSFSAKYFEEYFKGFEFEKSGSVQQQLTVPQVSKIDVLYPPIDILKKFDEITSPLTAQTEILKEENLKLAELRDWLLPMLMNGQVQVA